MFADPPRVSEIELQPVHSKGELVVDDWWRPQAAPSDRPFWRQFALEIVTLALPMTLGMVYLLAIASPRYLSESEFMVRTLSSPEMGNLASLFENQKVTRASDETYAVSEYLISRDVIDALTANDRLRDILARPQADFINRFPNYFTKDTRERLYRHFQDFIEIKVDTETGIARLRTIAFSPDDAQALNKGMLRNAEGFVNQLNTRVFSDSLSLAEREVEVETSKLSEIENRLTDYRNKQKILDPNKEVADSLSRIGALMTKLSQAESGLAQTTSLAPHAPQIASLSSEVSALRDQVAAERKRLSGQENSLSGKFAEFDRIMLDRLLASKQLESALAQYNSARQDASRKHFYLQTVVSPDLPDQSAYPRRFLSLAILAAICLAAYSILRAAIKNIREHLP